LKMIGIIGFGRFSALMARYLSKDFTVKICTRQDRKEEIQALGAVQASLEETCDLPCVVVSVPISAMESVLKQISPLLNKDAVVVDVCSVKVYPVQWMKEILPETVSILATHPMFGPDSAAAALTGRKIVLCKERIAESVFKKIEAYLTHKGLTVILTSPEEHDRQIAVSLSLTHFLGRTLAEFGATTLDIDTEGYKRLLHILEVVENDSWQLFFDMHRYNPYAQDIRKKFIASMEKIDRLID
jgi:prephenate dehydrogenase